MKAINVIYKINDKFHNINLHCIDEDIDKNIINIDYIKNKIAQTIIFDILEIKQNSTNSVTVSTVIELCKNNIEIIKIYL